MILPGHAKIETLLRVCFALLAIPALLSAQGASRHGPRLIVISVAGLDQRFLNEPASRLKIPAIRRLMRQGVMAGGVLGVAPSETWPSAVAMMTGVPPALESEATPLWQAASANGLKTAAVYWPGTAGAAIDFDLPPADEGRGGEDIPFDGVARRAEPAGIADRIEKTSPGFEKTLWNDASALTASLYALRVAKPDLLLVEFTDVDAEQRATRTLSVYAREMMEDDDERIGQIVAAAGPDAVVALVSGHGLEDDDYVVRPRVLVKGPVDVEDGLIGTGDRAVADRLRALLKDGRKHGLAREVPMAEVRAKAPSITNWVAAFDTPANVVASEEEKGPPLGPGGHRAVSGLWPDRPGYRSVFILAGKGIPARKIGEIDLLQIAPTLAGVLGVELPQAKAKSLWPVR